MSGLTQYRSPSKNLSNRSAQKARPEQLPQPQRGTSARYGVRLSECDRATRDQLFSSGGISRTFFAASARSIAFSAPVTASDLIAAWPLITTPATDAVHFQTPRSTP